MSRTKYTEHPCNCKCRCRQKTIRTSLCGWCYIGRHRPSDRIILPDLPKLETT